MFWPRLLWPGEGEESVIADPKSATIRCAIYTRKSVEKGLEQDFNSLDAQREAGEAYVQSQKGAGWQVEAERFDDGGFSGGTTERPALRRLLDRVEAGQVNVVVVYKTDRLSRSLLDFSTLLATLEKHEASFVSVTEQFNTATPSGRLMLNMIASFAEYERALIAERTRDKMGAARRKGKWTGGIPMLGYDVHPDGGKLVVNEQEAAQVRATFALYREIGSLAATCREMKDRGWERKSWITKRGTPSGGGFFAKNGLHHLLTSPMYLGKVKHHGDVYDGEHQAIVDQSVFDTVQALLRSNGHKRSAAVRNKHGAFLKGILYCSHCDRRMVHAPTRKGGRIYRYYVCGKAQAEGWSLCPTPSVAAGKLEAAVLGEIREAVQSPDLLMATMREAKNLRTTTLADLDRQLEMVEATLTNGAGPQEKRGAAKRKIRLEAERDRLAGLDLRRDDLDAALTEFTPLWDALTYQEQGELAAVLIERIDWDGEAIEIRMREGTDG